MNIKEMAKMVEQANKVCKLANAKEFVLSVEIIDAYNSCKEIRTLKELNKFIKENTTHCKEIRKQILEEDFKDKDIIMLQYRDDRIEDWHFVCNMYIRVSFYQSIYKSNWQ